MIIDTFTFFNELDTLEIRINELNPVVDYFVLVESASSHAGVKKPFFFEENMGRYSNFLEKIVYIKLEGLPPLLEDNEKSRFWLENFQRNQIMLGLLKLSLSNNDIVMI